MSRSPPSPRATKSQCSSASSAMKVTCEPPMTTGMPRSRQRSAKLYAAGDGRARRRDADEVGREHVVPLDRRHVRVVDAHVVAARLEGGPDDRQTEPRYLDHAEDVHVRRFGFDQSDLHSHLKLLGKRRLATPPPVGGRGDGSAREPIDATARNGSKSKAALRLQPAAHPSAGAAGRSVPGSTRRLLAAGRSASGRRCPSFAGRSTRRNLPREGSSQRNETSSRGRRRAGVGPAAAVARWASVDQVDDQVGAGGHRAGRRDGQDPGPDDVAVDASFDRREAARRARAHDRGGDRLRSWRSGNRACWPSRSTAAELASAAKPWMGSRWITLVPSVRMMRQPPLYVPSAIAAPQDHHPGRDDGVVRQDHPVATKARVITPIVFCASFMPWASESAAPRPAGAMRNVRFDRPPTSRKDDAAAAGS